MTAIADLPDIRPSLLLDFANSGRVDPRIECTRASAATCFGPDGKLRTVAANVPRIDYDPATGKCLGLLVEEARTNLLRQSSLLSDAAWVKSDVLVTPSDTQNALGLNFIKLTPISGTYKTINQTLSTAISDNQIVTFSVFAKAGEMNTIRLGVRNKANSIIAGHFNLLTGEASRQEITGKYLGDGWWRVTLSGTDMISGSATPAVHIYSINNGDATTPGDGVSGLYIAAPQLEFGSFPTSYIPTEGTAVTRAADVVQMTGASFASWYRQGEGTVIVSGDSPRTDGRLLTFSTGAQPNQLWLRLNSASQAAAIFKDGSYQTGFTMTTSSAGVLALAYKENDSSASYNGSPLSTDTLCSPPAVDRIDIGAAYGGAAQCCGHVSRIAYYPKRLTNAQIQRLTA
ncbi:phage head spike fiber domain-containing protein [Comamonas kerstersii]|uniref:phage head spike fiber domain-containing protein n=1 Tax=Comamonas kerstersii TaxID=225992 RepID=UPI001B340CD7|nr:hypothetical protein [Comamonas kerstersii]QTW20256.1 hypothetical protein H8N02_07520 [Comamonas kerstersii]